VALLQHVLVVAAARQRLDVPESGQKIRGVNEISNSWPLKKFQ
jgi:hypothetical protein